MKKPTTLISEIGAAAETRERLTKLESADSNLSIRGAIADCMRHGAVDEEADRVLAEIDAGTPDGKQLRGAFTRLTLATRNFSRTSVIAPARMSSYLGDATEALARLQISRASLQLAVVRVLTANEPHLWGDMDSPTEHANLINKTKDELVTAYKRIEETVTVGRSHKSPDRLARPRRRKINSHFQAHRRPCSTR